MGLKLARAEASAQAGEKRTAGREEEKGGQEEVRRKGGEKRDGEQRCISRVR